MRDSVILHAYDSAGHLLTWSGFRALQSNGRGSAGFNDVLLDPASLRITRIGPLEPRNGSPALRGPQGAALLALAWPSSDGYSQLLLPVPPPGTYNFNLLAARAAVAALERLLARRGEPPPSPDIAAVIDAATQSLSQAEKATREEAAAVAASRAYDAAIHAQLGLLQLYGSRRASEIRRGVTLDRLPDETALRRARTVVGPGGWVRIVLDPGTPLAAYAAPVAVAHGLGLKVLALPVDSSEMAQFSDDAWRTRIAAAVAALPGVDEWEAGNEVNGDWLGNGVAARVAWAVDYVHHHTAAPVLVTLYWQLGEGDGQHALFNWLSAHLDAVRTADDIGLSLYPEEHPLGSATDAVLNRLHAVLPGRQILISELGYWSADLDHTWWWGSRVDPMGAGRAAVASLYTSAIAAYGFGGGGSFWWYFDEEATPGTALAKALGRVWG